MNDDEPARCPATMDGVMRPERRERCGFVDDGHTRHRAKTSFGEVWWSDTPVVTPAQEETANG